MYSGLCGGWVSLMGRVVVGALRERKTCDVCGFVEPAIHEIIDSFLELLSFPK
jgi:hypothetical protein